MYEFLLRTETLLIGLKPPALLGIAAIALVIGPVFWLGGTRYSTIIMALFGAVIGATAGLIVGNRFDVHPWLSILIGAVIVAVLAILLKKALVLVLAVLILAAVSGAGYVSVVLDYTAPPPASETTTDQITVYHPFLQMAPDARLAYVDRIANKSPTFVDRLKALLDDTWAAIRPHTVPALIAVVAGAVVALVLVWLIAKIIIPLAHSIVGVAAIFVGLQAALLSVNVRATSDLSPRPWLLPVIFLVLVVIGWMWQLFSYRPARVVEQEEPEEMRRRAHKR
jgi:hypothetical protein